MKPRMNIFQVAPDGTKGMMAVEAAIEKSGLEHGLLELVKLRASQINGCAFCIYMHAKDALKHGETDMRLHLLERLARIAAVHRPRARRAQLDRGAHQGRRTPARRMRTTSCSRRTSTRPRSPTSRC